MITRALHSATDTALAYTVAVGAWTFALATYPLALAVSVAVATHPATRAFHDSLEVFAAEREQQ